MGGGAHLEHFGIFYDNDQGEARDGDLETVPIPRRFRTSPGAPSKSALVYCTLNVTVPELVAW
jgi:hypothetical protein